MVSQPSSRCASPAFSEVSHFSLPPPPFESTSTLPLRLLGHKRGHSCPQNHRSPLLNLASSSSRHRRAESEDHVTCSKTITTTTPTFSSSPLQRCLTPPPPYFYPKPIEEFMPNTSTSSSRDEKKVDVVMKKKTIVNNRSNPFDIEGTCDWQPPSEWDTELGSKLKIKEQVIQAIEEMERERLLAHSRKIVAACKRFGI